VGGKEPGGGHAPVPTATWCLLLAQECLHELEPPLPAVRRRRVSKRHEEHDFYGKTLEEALAWCLVWLMAPELGVGPFVV
jgi:hypothetical protein